MSNEFKKLACKSIAFEVSVYFPDMSVCQVLKRHGTLHPDHAETITKGELASAVPKRTSLASRLQHELDSLTSNSTSGGGCGAGKDTFAVTCDECITTIASCKPGKVLTKYMIVWATSTLKVSILRRGGHSQLNAPTSSSRTKGTSTASTSMELECHSLHIVNADVMQRRRPGSFALQSIFQPRYPFLLECYPRHVLHLALVTYALWHQGLSEKPSSNAADTQATAHKASSLRDLLPASDGDAVLVLGLGGNVIGHCLDHLLDPAVRIDTVEIEPAVVQTCVEQHQVPPLCEHTVPKRFTDGLKATRTGKGAAATPTATDGDYTYWSASSHCQEDNPHGAKKGSTQPVISSSATRKRVRGEPAFTTAQDETSPRTSPRGPNYRFFVDDAYRFLRNPSLATGSGSQPLQTDYNMIFLDCYDPDREKMIFEESLVSLCHKRLRPGGCLLVNAHILPKLANLEGAFLFHGFATVQALRVAGCDQCIVACVRADADDADGTEHSAVDALVAKQQRFTRANACQMARRLNIAFIQRWQSHCDARASPPRKPRRTELDVPVVANLPFLLEPDWLSKSTVLTRMEMEESGKAPRRMRQSDCRVWEHNT